MRKRGRAQFRAARTAPLLIVILTMLAASPSVAQDEVYARVLGNSTDRAIVTVTRTTEGRETTHEEYGENAAFADGLFTWRREPTTLTVTMVSRNYWSFERVRWDLAQWQIIYDQALAIREQMLQYSGPMSTIYSDPGLSAAYDAVERYSADVELLLRVLTGIEYFEVIAENYPNRIGPVSDPPQLTAGQASAYSKWTSVSVGGEETVSEASADAESYQVSSPEWGFDDYEAAAARAGVDPAQFNWTRSNGHLMSMVLWRYDPADMARVAELIENLDAIAAELHWDPPQMDDPNFQVTADGLANSHNATYERIFVSAVRDVVRHAWALGPQEAPPGFWTNVDPVNGYELPLPPEGMPSDPFGVYFMAADVPLALPDLPGDRIAVLRLPVDGLAPDQPVGPIFKSSGTTALSFGPTFNGGYWLKDADRVVSVGLPERERHRFSGEIMGPHAFSNVNIAGGSVLEGSFTTVYHFIDDPEFIGTTKTHYDHEYKVHVTYSIAIEGGDREDFSIPMTLSLAHRVEGEIVPLTAPLNYGDGFYVEGLLEEPATREAYSVDVVLNGVSEKVVLKPVEKGGLLLRSEMRYLIWDVAAERADVALPARLAP